MTTLVYVEQIPGNVYALMDSVLFTDKKKGCFPSTARVNLENGKVIKMSELQIGDKVQTGIVSKQAHIVMRAICLKMIIGLVNLIFYFIVAKHSATIFFIFHKSFRRWYSDIQ